jgi:hypothetical protein
VNLLAQLGTLASVIEKMGDVGSGEVDLTKVDFTDRGLSLLGRLADAIRAISREHSVFLKNPYHTTDTEMEYNAGSCIGLVDLL